MVSLRETVLPYHSIETTPFPERFFILFYHWDVVPNPTKGAAFGNPPPFEKGGRKLLFSQRTNPAI